MDANEMNAYPIDTAGDRLHEITADQQPVLITQSNGEPWVFLPANRYNSMLSAVAVCDILNEQHRQHHEPLPRP